MATIRDLMQGYMEQSYHELLSLARRNLGDVTDAIHVFFKDDGSLSKAVYMIVAACLGADGKLSEQEYRFVNDLLDTAHSYSETVTLVKGLGTTECRAVVDALADSLDGKSKTAMISLCLCFLAVDETIPQGEISFLKALIG